MNELYGFKCFNKDMTNRYGRKIEVGKIYTTTGDVKFGNDSHGFHFCKNLEDTFRYFNATEEEVSVCYVRGFGKIDEYEDDYNGYYGMYAAENIEIMKKLSRQEIITYELNKYEERVIRFIQTFKLTNEEIYLFQEKFSNNDRVIKAISYYQIGDKTVYMKK